ncbi:hypothetical protein ORI20_07255 [Mycobacterium sp. CVI_P3]|uniref:DUF4386 domain-containing protein n=1 Tax=Mycobacterium pinniadriaticum TaxID=2994102 RepID=A0ABT3S9V3_9MYCO|nr:hypothetical protein [Mycobacterium pinniadriaticum]MCX2930064.1 hypothetical protein [Mycobacterium pinniadriaticum]MCX2936287.1 hypothetical protein [Mycobacterium pinniadriaticum]
MMGTIAKSRIQLFGAWCGVIYTLLIFGGWGIVAGLLPPIAPSAGPEQVARLFAEDTMRIRVGMIIVMFSALMLFPFVAVIAQMIARIEGGAGVLTYTFLLGGAGNMVLSFYPPMWWLTAAYRPDRSADLLYLVNDTAWLQFIGGVSIYLAMPLSIMVASLCDKSPNPVFPRWSGYAMGWIALITIPDQMLFFFHGGPFAWNGVLGLWIPAVMFGLFFLINTFVIRAAVLRERATLTGDTTADGTYALQPNGR